MKINGTVSETGAPEPGSQVADVRRNPQVA